ncbi:MAG: SDR family NAD(P)-dependent oxidoreductase [Candidatus Velthaea sp.]
MPFPGRVASFALAAGLLAAGASVLSRRRSSAAFARGQCVLVTGGSRGLGFMLAEAFARADARVTICARSAEELERAASRLAEEGLHVESRICDVRDRLQCEALVREVEARGGPLDILINNAGTIEVGPLADQTVDDFREAMDTHFWGPLYLMLAVLPGMRARRGGRIVNIASVGGLVGVPHLAPYCASKFAQVGLTQAVAAEAAADGVQITSVCPGLMYTGSPDHAFFKGRYRAEYAWFAISDANPMLSVSPEAAVRRILRAIRRGEAQALIGTLPKVAKTLNALFPETTSRLLALSARMLPPSGGVGTERRSGADSHSAVAPSILTLADRRSVPRTNQ